MQRYAEPLHECASAQEIQDRMGNEVFVTQVEVSVGYAANSLWSRSLCNLRGHEFQQVRQRGRHIVMQRVTDEGTHITDTQEGGNQR